jgi:phosphate uptake regulator
MDPCAYCSKRKENFSCLSFPTNWFMECEDRLNKQVNINSLEINFKDNSKCTIDNDLYFFKDNYQNNVFYIQILTDWCKKQKIEKISQIKVINKKSHIIVTRAENENISFDIDIDNLESYDLDYLKQIVVGAYITGFNPIRFISGDNNKKAANIQPTITWFLKLKIGSDIIIARIISGLPITLEILEHYDQPIIKTIKRMETIVKEMVESVFKSLQTNEEKEIDEINTKDDQLDVSHWFVHRRTSKILLAQTTSDEFTPIIAMQIYIISRAIERMGDHAITMGNQARKIIRNRDESIHSDTLFSLNKVKGRCIRLFDTAIEAFYITEGLTYESDNNKNVSKMIEALNLTREVFKNKKGFRDECEILIKQIIEKENTNNAVSLSSIVESIIKIGDLASDISTSTINKVLKIKMVADKQNLPKYIPKQEKFINNLDAYRCRRKENFSCIIFPINRFKGYESCLNIQENISYFRINFRDNSHCTVYNDFHIFKDNNQDNVFYVQILTDWCKKQKIEKISQIKVINKKSHIFITRSENRDIYFNIDIDNLESDDLDYLKQIVVGAYITGFDQICFLSGDNNKKAANIEPTITWFLKHKIGSDISIAHLMENNSQPSIEILEHYDQPIIKTIKRMETIVKEMVESIFNSLETNEEKEIDEINKKDDQLDVSHWFVHRRTSKILLAQTTSDEFTPIIAMQIYIISRAIERMGDHAIKMGNQARKIIRNRDESIYPETLFSLNKVKDCCIHLFDTAIEAFYITEGITYESDDNKNVLKMIEALNLTREVFKNKKGFRDECEILIKQIIEKENINNAVSLSSIVESILKIGDLASDISTSTINKVLKIKMVADRQNLPDQNQAGNNFDNNEQPGQPG